MFNLNFLKGPPMKYFKINLFSYPYAWKSLPWLNFACTSKFELGVISVVLCIDQSKKYCESMTSAFRLKFSVMLALDMSWNNFLRQISDNLPFYLKPKFINKLVYKFDFDTLQWELFSKLDEDYICKYTCTVLQSKDYSR